MKKKRLTEEHKRKIRETTRTPEHRAFMSKIHKGKKISKEQKMLMSKLFKGREIPDWQQKRMSDALHKSNVKGIETCRFLARYLGIENTCILLEIAKKTGNYHFYIPKLPNALKAISGTKERVGLFMNALDHINPSLLLSLCILFPSEQWWLPRVSPWKMVFKE